jgi:hypothetical protein
MPIRLATQSKLNVENKQDSSLDLGNDQMDYKTTTFNKHQQRYKKRVHCLQSYEFVASVKGEQSKAGVEKYLSVWS